MVHQYKLNGYNIVLDTCSGGIHVVDEVAYDIIALIRDKSADEIIAEMMAKYGHREDVTEEELRLCIGDVEGLIQAGKQVFHSAPFRGRHAPAFPAAGIMKYAGASPLRVCGKSLINRR